MRTQDQSYSSQPGAPDQLRLDECENMGLKAFEYSEHTFLDFGNGTDPENNLFKNINNNCYYYSEEEVNAKVKQDHNFSIIHFISRSLYANFISIKNT